MILSTFTLTHTEYEKELTSVPCRKSSVRIWWVATVVHVFYAVEPRTQTLSPPVANRRKVRRRVVALSQVKFGSVTSTGRKTQTLTTYELIVVQIKDRWTLEAHVGRQRGPEVWQGRDGAEWQVEVCVIRRGCVLSLPWSGQSPCTHTITFSAEVKV